MSRVHHLAAWLTRMKAGDAKVFCIGFNKTGTTSLHAFFEHEGLTSMHNIAWPVESHRLTGRSFFEKTTCYTDGEQAAFHRLEEWFPNAVFVLNTRDERSWLRSRIKHVMRFGVPSGQPGCTVLDRLGTMGHEFFAYPEMALAAWLAQRRTYEASVRAHFRGNDRFIELRVTEDRDWAQTLRTFLVKNRILPERARRVWAPDANKRASEEIRDQAQLAEYLSLAEEVLKDVDAIRSWSKGHLTLVHCRA